MTYEEAEALIREHMDYGGGIKVRALATTLSVCADGVKGEALTALAGLVHVYVGLCRDSGIDPGMNTQYRNARATLAATKGPQ